MDARAFTIALALCLASGCAHPKGKVPVVNLAVAPYEQFVAKNIDWSSVRRVVLMPLANQTGFPRVNYELQSNLAAELQRAGRFEIVVASYEDPAARAQDVFATGQFNELDLLRIADEYKADAVIFANVTQYHPYSRPRIGLSLLIVSPAEGIAIASLSGLWDAREASTSVQAQAYFKQTQSWPKSLLSVERVFESPDVFQRFVCQQIAVSLSPPAPGGGGAIETMMPLEVMRPVEGTMQSETVLPMMPPASMEEPQ